MRLIAKGSEPATVRDTRLADTTNLSTVKTARDAFNQLDKTEVREALSSEQGALCAFCMRHIDRNATDYQTGQYTTAIAHLTPLDVDSTQALTWTNMVASCEGGRFTAGRPRTCDNAQGGAALHVDPTKQRGIAQLHYERRGARGGLFITSSDAAIREDVDEKLLPNGRVGPGTLGLNQGDLPELRQRAWRAFCDSQKKAYPNAFGKQARREFFPKWRGRWGPNLPDFVGVIEAKIKLLISGDQADFASLIGNSAGRRARAGTPNRNPSTTHGSSHRDPSATPAGPSRQVVMLAVRWVTRSFEMLLRLLGSRLRTLDQVRSTGAVLGLTSYLFLPALIGREAVKCS